ncbi:zinc finger protein 704-like [Hypomesus transpacificus]|uniref:zinc finger protein 704-like n=1 Tax=Hypomesus transpacificus TaxID=137520 RepID=UPI001F076881|nr:zinc finger protein 704-like [Hypomesus transpacificus]
MSHGEFPRTPTVCVCPCRSVWHTTDHVLGASGDFQWCGGPLALKLFGDFFIHLLVCVCVCVCVQQNSMKVMFKCLWKNCGKVLSTAAGIQRHIRTVHLGRNCDSDGSDGEEDFYYTEIKLNTDAVADGLGSLSPASPSVPPPPAAARPPPPRPRSPPATPTPPTTPTGASPRRPRTATTTPLSRSAPSALYLIHTDHAYQATAPVTIPSTHPGSDGSSSFTPSSGFSISWQSPPVTFTGNAASPTHSRTQGFGEQRSQTIAVLSSPPRATGSLSRKSRSEGKKCRKVYGMENRDMWCTACRWKKACQRFTD